MRALVASAGIAVAVGFLAYSRSPLCAAALLALAFTLAALRSPGYAGRALLLALPLAAGMSWFSWAVAGMRGGDQLGSGLLALARILALAEMSAYFASSTDPYELAESLSRVAPASIAYAFYTAYLIGYKLLVYAAQIAESYKSRGLYEKPWEAARLAVPFFRSLLFYAYRTAETVGLSMEARGLSDQRVFWRRTGFGARDAAEIAVLAVGAAVSALVL